MPEIILPVDPVALTLEYLNPFFPDAVVGMDVPSDWAWGALLIVVTDVGGDGMRDIILDDVNLMIEVSHEDSVTASETARKIHGLLRAWTWTNRAVYWRRTLQRPTYMPDEETETPAYSLTVSLTFRMTKEQVEVP